MPTREYLEERLAHHKQKLETLENLGPLPTGKPYTDEDWAEYDKIIEYHRNMVNKYRRLLRKL